MAIEIVSFPIQNGGSFHSYVSLPEGNGTGYGMIWIYVMTVKLLNDTLIM